MRSACSLLWSSKVAAGTCTTPKGLWKFFKSEKVWQHYQEKLGDRDDKYTWQHTCAACWGKETGKSTRDAESDIVSVWYEPRRARASRVSEALAAKAIEFPTWSKSKIRVMAMSDLSTIWKDLADCIARKCNQLAGLCKQSARVDELKEKLRLAKTTADAEKIKAEIDAATEEEYKHLAYANRPDQAEMLMASSYADEFARTSDGAGYFRCWFMCLAGGSTWPCMTVCPSKSWTRRFSDPTASKQRWFCTECSARFKTKFGCLIEIVSVSGVRCFVRATVPDMDVQDIRAMQHERIYQGRDSKQLFDLLPVIPPTTGDLLIPLDPVLGTARIASKELLDALPMFKWESIFTLA